MPTDPRRRVASNKIFFPLAFTFSVFYALLYGQALLGGVGTPRLLILAVGAMITAPLIYTAILWHRRDELIPLDRHILSIPFAIWYVGFILVQGIDGHGKSMSNGFVESMCVLTMSGIYLLRFTLNRNRTPEGAARIASRLFWSVAAGAILVTLLFPPLPE